MNIRAIQDYIIAILLFVAALASRIPVTSATLYHWDSVNFALALDEFNLVDQQPHPPGYILYIAAGRILNFFLGDPNSALVALSVVGGVAAVVGIFYVGRSIFGRTTGIVASILLLVSPLAWHYSEVALSYSMELPLVLAATWFLYQLFFHRRYAVAAAIIIGLAAGFRQDVLIFFGPFWFIGSLRVARSTMLYAWVAMAVTVLVWMAPLFYLAGGVSAYREFNMVTMKSLYGVSVLKAGANGFSINARQMWPAFLWLFGIAGIVWFYFAGLLLFSRTFRNDRRIIFLILLLLPPLSFFLLVHFGQPGYLVAYGSPLLLLAARTLVILSRDASRFLLRIFPGSGDRTNAAGNILLVIFLSATALINTTLYIYADSINMSVPFADGSVSSLYRYYSSKGVNESDRQLSSVEGVIRRYNPDDTLVVSLYPYDGSLFASWRRLMYYLPEYDVVMLRDDEHPGVYYEAKEHVADELFYRQHRLHDWLPDHFDLRVPAGYRRVVFIGFSAGEMPPQLEWIEENTTTIPISSVALPASGSLTVGRYRISH